MLLRWREQAQVDLDAIVEYLLEHNPAAALDLRNTIGEQIGLLIDFPDLGRPERVAGTRELVIARTPYIVARTVDRDADLVVVLRVLHGARLWPEHF